MLIKQFIVTQHLDFNLLNWEFEPTTEDLDNLTLNVYRSESQGIDGTLTDFQVINSGITLNETSYRDDSVVGLMDPLRFWNYKLTLKNNFTNTETLLTSQPAFVKAKPESYIAKAILRKKELVLTKKIGRQFYLIKKRSWGVRCPDSWDDVLFRDTNPNCPTCFGTGWTGGYFTPIPMLGMVNAAPKYNQIQMFGEWKPSDKLLYTINYPILLPRDIIVDDNNLRWIVIQVRTVEHLGFLIEQQAQIGLIQPDDYIYTLNLQ
jgi:hypothetical protein